MAKTASPKATALTAFEERFKKSFGPHTLHHGPKISTYEVIPTGSIGLDYAVGVGGYVVGRLHEFYGVDDVGKSTLAFMACAEAQRQYPNRMVGYLDVEHKVDEAWADAWGVDRSRWYLAQPDVAEDCADMVTMMLQEPAFAMVVIDSIGALIGRVEMEKKADDDTVAVVARIVTRMVKAANANAAKNGTAVLMINQLRANISSTGRGAATTTTGGWAIKYGTTMRFKIRYTDQAPLKAKIGGDDVPVARQIAIEVERNKCAPKGRTAMVTLVTVPSGDFGPIGVNRANEAVSLAVKLGVIAQGGGGYYTLPDETRIRGLEAVQEHVAASQTLVEDLRRRIIETRAGEIKAEIPDDVEDVVVEGPTGKGKYRKAVDVHDSTNYIFKTGE